MQARIRLFCFPFAGSGPPVFRRWPRAFPDQGLEFWALNLPGRGSRFREAPLTEMQPLVEKLADEITGLQDKPFAFFGHSLGGRLAYELSCILRDRGRPQPKILFVSACYPPQMPLPQPLIHTLSDEAFLVELRRLNGMPDAVLAERELVELLLPMIRADMTMIETAVYTPAAPLAVPLVAMGGSDDDHVPEQVLADWSELTSASFSMQLFPGDHFYLQTAEDLLLETIKQWLSE